MATHTTPVDGTAPKDGQTDTIASPVAAARAAGLRYVTDTSPGIQRKRVGKHFSYTGLDGKPIHDAYLDGSLLKALKKQDEETVLDALDGLRPEEISVLAFLEP